jgi:hypothetical protein
MRDIHPKPPQNLNPYARELLDALAGHPEASQIVLGGGVALSHYLEYRGTVDVDAWWRTDANRDTRDLAHRLMEDLAERHGLQFRLRRWGDTESYELLRDARKVFSFQISTRTRYLDPPQEGDWTPVMIETLRDNVASKMTALVERGAPRDLRDIYELCKRGVVSIEECWQLWKEKESGREAEEGRAKVRFHIERLELQRPLEKIGSPDERAAAAALRQWFGSSFCTAGAL